MPNTAIPSAVAYILGYVLTKSMISLPRLTRLEFHPSLFREVAWHAVALLLLVIAPVQLWLRRPLWELTPQELPQVFAIAVGYLALAVVLRIATERARGIAIGSALAWGAGCFATAGAVIATRHDLALSRALYAICAVLGIALAIVPLIIAHRRGVLMLTFGFLILGTCVLGAQERRTDSNHRRVRGALYMMDLAYFRGLVPVPTKVRGGGIASFGKGFLLVNGDGEFYRLWWNAKGDSLRARRMGLTTPINMKQMTSDMANPSSVPRLRAADVIVDSLSNPMRAIVSYMYWHHDAGCITLRVSAIDLDSAAVEGTSHGSWTPLYETQPCLKPTGAFDDIEVGGRLAWMPDRSLLLSTGDFGFDGLTSAPLSQQLDNDYGKILQLDGKGGREIYSIGHRNPQGLVVARDGRIWESEHGPQGGDEINLIVKGGNYGWPFATYGTQYGLDYWPVSPNGRDHGKFVEPAHVFVPSEGVSAMIEMSDRQFPRSAGDLFVLSLRGQKMLRARVRGDRITYVKPTQLDGRIVIWTDEGDVVVISRANWELTGSDVYVTCASCHEPAMGETKSAAPTLHGLIGRPVASLPGYNYSSGLRAVGGEWTKERLNAFLAHPAAFAPGTLMKPWAIGDDGQRRAVVDYLAALN